MKLLILTFLFILGVGLGNGKSAITKINPILGHRQLEVKSLLDSIADGKWKIYDPYMYNENFRPPSGDEIHPNPTLVRIGLTELIVKSLNDTKGLETANLKGKFSVQYTDSRLEFDSPPGYEKDYVNAQYGTDYNKMDIWDPKIISVTEDELSPTSYSKIGLSDAVFFNNKGQVYSQYMVDIGTKSNPEVEADGKRITFKVQLTVKQFPTEDLVIEWRDTENAVKVKDTQKMVKVEDSGKEYKFTASSGKCKRLENYGPIGEIEYPCAELKLKFELVN